jgi:cellulose synthase/poly-beta-1,6-N-acetylglucosamine synthase-like glycosyltransferase
MASNPVQQRTICAKASSFAIDTNRPLVTLLIVVRNGAHHIIGALDSFCQQNYAPMDIVVVDGMSDDHTRQLVEDYARKTQVLPIRLLDNPGRIQATGWNIGIRAAKGDYVLRLDAVHCRLTPDYVRCCLETLLDLKRSDPRVAAVGGRRMSVAATEDPWGQAIALAQTSSFGVGNATYRLSKKAGFTDTLGVAIYDRSILLNAGLFNESLGRSEDNELHARLREQGFKLFYLPDAVAIYYPRTTLASVASQMFQNGWWISATTMRMRAFPFGIRHVAPFGFFLAIFLAGILGTSFLVARILLFAMLGLYVVASLGAALYTSSSRRFWRVTLVFWLMHACYAGGTLAGFFGGMHGPSGQEGIASTDDQSL